MLFPWPHDAASFHVHIFSRRILSIRSLSNFATKLRRLFHGLSRLILSFVRAKRTHGLTDLRLAIKSPNGNLKAMFAPPFDWFLKCCKSPSNPWDHFPFPFSFERFVRAA